MKAIIHADDFGVSFGVNEGIDKAFTSGILTSTSIRTNGAAYEDAVKRLKKKLKPIGLGLHLNLTDGKTHLSELSNKNGFYRYSFPEYIFQSFNKNIRDCIFKELDEQFRIVKESGLTIDHVDGQDHIHMIPAIFEIVCQLCVKHDIKAIRVAREPMYTLPSPKETLRPVINGGLLKAGILSVMSEININTLRKYKLVTTDAYFGVLHTNFMTENAFKAILNCAEEKNINTIEIACHPGIPHEPRDTQHTSPFFEFYTNLPARQMELQTLLSPSLKKLFEEKNIKHICFSDLSK